jgi:hypothetical protein
VSSLSQNRKVCIHPWEIGEHKANLLRWFADGAPARSL